MPNYYFISDMFLPSFNCSE